MAREEEMRKAAREYAKEESTAVIRKYEAFKAGVKQADNHPAKKHAVTIDAWAAKDSDGLFSLYKEKPRRDKHLEYFVGMTFCELENVVPFITWENSPKKVKITIELEDE